MHCLVTMLSFYVSPLYTEGETSRFTSHRSFFTMSCLTPRCMWASVTDGRPTLTPTYSFVYPLLCLHCVYIIFFRGPHGRRVKGQWVGVGLHCLTRSPANTRREPVLVLGWASVADGGPELDQHWVNVSCLLGVLTGHICVIVDHLPGSKS